MLVEVNLTYPFSNQKIAKSAILPRIVSSKTHFLILYDEKIMQETQLRPFRNNYRRSNSHPLPTKATRAARRLTRTRTGIRRPHRGSRRVRCRLEIPADICNPLMKSELRPPAALAGPLTFRRLFCLHPIYFKIRWSLGNARNSNSGRLRAQIFETLCELCSPNTVCFESHTSIRGGCLSYNRFSRFYSGSNSQLPDPGRAPLQLSRQLF